MKEGAPLRPESFRDAVKKTGFTPTWMKVRARGVVAEREGRPSLRVSESGQAFSLVENGVLEDLQSKTGLDEEDVLVTATVEGGDPVVLRLEAFEVD